MNLPSFWNRIVPRLLFFLTCLSTLSTSWSQTQNLPVDHWAYGFLERLETRGLYISRDFDTRPYSREAVAGIILQIDRRVRSEPGLLSHVEQELFEQLKGEFHEELELSGDEVAIRENEYEPHIYQSQSKDIKVRFDGLISEQAKFETKRKVDRTIPNSIFSVGLRFRANIKKSLAIFAESRSFVLSGADSIGNTVYNPALGLPVTKKALIDITVTDNATSYVVFRLPWLNLEAGRDLVEWGPGFRGNLLLSRNSNYYDMFKFTFRYQKFKFEHFHAFLNSDSTKYLAAHRLEIRLWKHFQVALNESVVYGERHVEFLYFNPFVPFIISERHLGDQDNNMISLDATLFLTKANVQLYSEMLFDDFSFAKDLFGSFGNKWGVLLGGFWVDPLGLSNSGFRFEFVRLQPFVYSHKFSRNTYSNYNNTLGHWLGPDADDIYLELSFQPHKNLRLRTSWEQSRKGRNDITEGSPPERPIQFLEGVVERIRLWGLVGTWQIHRDIFLNLTYHLVQAKNLQRKDGINQTNHRLFVNLSFDY
ncbi:MAG: capsule assembly Wzi family protein [bacterium]